MVTRPAEPGGNSAGHLYTTYGLPDCRGAPPKYTASPGDEGLSQPLTHSSNLRRKRGGGRKTRFPALPPTLTIFIVHARGEFAELLFPRSHIQPEKVALGQSCNT